MKIVIILFVILNTIAVKSQDFLSVDKVASFDEWVLDLSSDELSKLYVEVDSVIAENKHLPMKQGEEYSYFVDVNYDGKVDLIQEAMMMGADFYCFFPGTDSGFGEYSVFAGSLHKVSSPDGKNPMKVEVFSNPCCGAINMTCISYNPVINEDHKFVYEINSKLHYFNKYTKLKGDHFDLSGKKFECVKDSVHLLVEANKDSDKLMFENGGGLGASYPQKAVGEIVAAREIGDYTWYFVIMQHEIPDYFNSIHYEPFSKNEYFAAWIRADQVKILD